MTERRGLPPAAARASEERVLRGALVGAFAIHVALISVFGFIPSWRTKGVDLEEIHVFASAGAAFARPVELVSLQELEKSSQEATIILTTPASSLRAVMPTQKERPQREAGSGQGRPSGAAKGAAGSSPKGKHSPASSRFQGESGKSQSSASSGREGGGGGGLRLPAAQVRQREGEVAIGGGNTALGGVPGTGTGSGPGSGSGLGTGIGRGEGSGIGDSSGEAGRGNGSGSGAAGSSAFGPGAGGSGGGFVSRSADRSEPQVSYKGSLSYPSGAAEEGMEGTVVLKVLVDEKGEVAAVEITSSSGDRRLDAAAREWVRGWRYLPAVQDGQPRRVWTKARVTFRLE